MSASSALAMPAISLSRRRGTSRGSDANTRTTGAREVDELLRLDRDVGVAASSRADSRMGEEVRAEPLVLDEERRAVVEPAEELHDGAIAAQPVGGVHDEARSHLLRSPAARCALAALACVLARGGPRSAPRPRAFVLSAVAAAARRLDADAIARRRA